MEIAMLDPDVTEFARFVAMRAVIETFSDLVASCEDGAGVCVICHEKECDPGCVRNRADNALRFLTGGMK
jgi:hypothetical protein